MHDASLSALPDVFRFTEAVEFVGERKLRTLVSTGHIDRISRGLYRKANVLGDEDLTEIIMRSPQATVCLQSALVRHDLIDDIPAYIDIAVPRGTWTPKTLAPVQWRHFDPDTFEIGREKLEFTGGKAWLYSPERSIIDAFRLKHLVGYETGTESLKAWLRKGGNPASLLRVARSFPRAFPRIQSTMELLL